MSGAKDPFVFMLSPERICNSLPGLNRLLEVARVLALEIDLDRALDAIVQEACRALQCERALLYQYDPKRETLVTTAGTDVPIHLAIDQGIPGYVVRQRQMVNVPDIAADPRWDSTYDEAAGYETRTILAVPLIAARDGRLLGVLEMLNNQGGPFDADDESLAIAFSNHAAAALDRARLVDEIQRRKELEASLNIAREFQRRFMPSQMPQIPGYEAATWWLANEAVGGDYCDVIPLAAGCTAFCIADVCGHGLGPSLLMASVRASLRTLLLRETSPQLLLETLGRALLHDFHNGAFVTMFLAILDPRSHQIRFANAGQAPALLYHAESRSFVELESTGLPIGVIDPPDCPLGPVLTMHPGDMVILGTDGIVEAVDQRGTPFGIERLQECIGKCAGGSLPEMVREIGREVQLHYVGDNPPDDLTLLAVRRNG
jgi:phosphoserine phosphatase RsbU/P